MISYKQPCVYEQKNFRKIRGSAIYEQQQQLYVIVWKNNRISYKVLGTSFSWISGKNSLVPTYKRLFIFALEYSLQVWRHVLFMEPCILTKKFWEQVFRGFRGKNHLFQRKSGCSDFCSSIPCSSRDLILMEPCISTEKFWEQVFLGFQEKTHLFQRKSGCSDLRLSILCLSDVTFSLWSHASRWKSFGNKFFLDFREKLTCSNVQAAVHICAWVFPASLTSRSLYGTMHLDGKVLGTSFSWISWKNSLVPT